MITLDPWTIFFAAIFTNNILLTNFLGLCPFLAISREVRSSLGLGVAVVFVITCTAALNHVIYYYVLIPLNLEHFRYIVFIIIIAAFVQLVEMAVERFFPALYFVLGIFLSGKIYQPQEGQFLSYLATFACMGHGPSLFMMKFYPIEGNIRSATFEYGTTFILIAGLMNMLLILDAYDISVKRKG